MNQRKEVYEVYSPNYDITTIFEDVIIGEKVISTEVKGFYWGKPEEEATQQFYGKTKATFE